MKRTRHDTPEVSLLFLGLTALITLSMLIMSIRAEAQEWHSEPTVSLNQYNAHMDATGAAKYALWSIRSRTGKSGTFIASGQGQISISWRTSTQIQALTGYPYAGWAQWNYDWNGYFTSVEIWLNRDLITSEKMLFAIMMHEMGHAFGADIHHNGSHGVFNPNTDFPYDYTLTTQDVLKLPHNTRSLCHIELTQEGDLFIPDGQGMQGMLRYEGNYQWHLAFAEVNPASAGCTNVSMDSAGTIEMYGVKGFDQVFSYVRLAATGADRWQLEYAE